MIMVAVSFRHNSQEHHAARHALQHVGEIFCTHERRRHRDVIILAHQLDGDATCEMHETRVVNRDRIAAFDVNLRLAQMRRSDIRRHPTDALMSVITGGLGCRPQRAEHFHRLGDDVAGRPASNLAAGQDDRIEGVTAPSDHRVQRNPDFTGNRHRVDRQMRHRGMAATPPDFDFPGIYGRQQWPGPAGDRSGLEIGEDVQSERGIGFRVRIE